MCQTQDKRLKAGQLAALSHSAGGPARARTARLLFAAFQSEAVITVALALTGKLRKHLRKAGTYKTVNRVLTLQQSG